MIDVARYRGLLLAVLGVAVATAAVDLVLTVAVGPTARWLPHGEYPADRWVIGATGRRLAGADRDLRRDKAGAKLGILLGQSTLECGIDPAVLGADDGLPIRWLNLFGEGGSIHKIDELADLVFISGLKPDVVAFVINPYMLVGTDYDTIRSNELRVTNNRIKPWVWTWDNRVIANHLALMTIEEGRVRLFRSFGLGIAALFPPDPRPWETDAVVKPHKTGRELEDRLEYNRRVGWLDPRNYRPDGGNALALGALIRKFRALGSEVVIVLMPTRSLFRDALPPEALACVSAVAREATPGRPVPIIDLGDKLPDALFLDLDHVDVEGRALCSRLLAARLHDLLAGGLRDQ